MPWDTPSAISAPVMSKLDWGFNTGVWQIHPKLQSKRKEDKVIFTYREGVVLPVLSAFRVILVTQEFVQSKTMSDFTILALHMMFFRKPPFFVEGWFCCSLKSNFFCLCHNLTYKLILYIKIHYIFWTCFVGLSLESFTLPIDTLSKKKLPLLFLNRTEHADYLLGLTLVRFII